MSYWMKPGPVRCADWEAHLDDYEPGHPIGYGATKEAAIADLRQVYELRYDEAMPDDIKAERQYAPQESE
jgi:hypothetical protein